jgi:GrpB-like predicted nucleotidyltransferase (UPF0157 family)
MIKESQRKYLESLTPERLNSKVYVQPYDPKIEKIAEKIIGKIRKLIPNVDVRFLGASALKISGQNDIDIYILTPKESKENYINLLKDELGPWPTRKWKWSEEGIEISVYLSDPDDYKLKEQLDLFEILTTNKQVLREYEDLKESMNGSTYEDYQTAKYEFYNKVLDNK